MRMDCHTHTATSPDGFGSAITLCHQAIANHLDGLAITDHVELNRFFSQETYQCQPRNEWEFFDYEAVFQKAVKTASQCKQAFAGTLRVACGIELGQANADFALADRVVQHPDLDFVIGSLHELSDQEDFFSLTYTPETIPALMEQYFSELLTICQWGKFDVLGHLTYPLRYIEGEHGFSVPCSVYEEQIRQCFSAVIQAGKGIELNVSGLRQKYGKPFPTLELLRLYRELGGEILTIGTDAHCAADLGSHLSDGIRSWISVSLLVRTAPAAVYCHINLISVVIGNQIKNDEYRIS